MASIRSTARVLPLRTTLPASIGPPETNTAGMLRRMAAISMPGVILSQLEMQTIASAQWALTMYSTAVGDQLARRQAVQHAVMAHGDAVVDGDGVELLGHAAGGLDLAGDELAEILEMDMAGDELGEGIGDGDDGLAEIAVLHAGGPPQTAGTGHVAAMRGGAGTQRGHRTGLLGVRPYWSRSAAPTQAAGAAVGAGGGLSKQGCSFLKKRTKKLSIRCAGGAGGATRGGVGAGPGCGAVGGAAATA